MPVLARLHTVIDELGCPTDALAARVLVADDWLRRLAAGGPAANSLWLTDELLWNGDYAWFRLALYDLELLAALEAGLAQSDEELRERAALVLGKTREERLAATPSAADARPFTRQAR